MKILNNKKGLTLIEFILGIVITAIIILVIIQTFISQTDAFHFVANRKSTIADMRFTLVKMASELENIGYGDITDIQSDQMTFTTSATGPITYQFYTVDSISRNTDVLLNNVNNFWFNYYNMNGTPLTPNSANIPNVRRIKISIESKPIRNEGYITISTFIVPRRFLGYDLQ